MESTTSPRITADSAAIAGESAMIQVIDAAMQRAWATAEPILLLVRAERPDTQKSIVEQLQSQATESGAWSLTAETNVVGLDGPYAPLLRALTAFASRIAKEPGSLGVSIRHRIAHVAAPTGGLLASLCPAFAPMARSSIEPEPLSFGYARDRLETLLVRVFAALSPTDVPVVLFLRHAHRTDAATLRSLSRILAHAETRQLAVVALMDPRDPPRHEAAWRTFISGKKYVVERFDVGSGPKGAEVDPKAPMPNSGVTNHAHPDSPPHSGFFATQLDPELQRLLEAVACSGQTAELDAIGIALQRSPQDLAPQLVAAIEAGLLRRQGSTYGFVDPREALVCHSEMPPHARGRMHLRLGKAFAFDARAQQGFGAKDAAGDPQPQMFNQGERVPFVAAAHFVTAIEDGATAEIDDAERMRIAHMLLDVGRRAMNMAAQDVADAFLDAGVRVLAAADAGGSSIAPDVAIALEFARLECACAAGNRSRAKQLFDSLRDRAPNAPELPSAWRWLVEMATRLGEHVEAVELASRALAPHGIHLQTAPTSEDIDRAFQAVWEALGDRAIEEVADLERMTNRQALDATEMLFTVHPSAQALGAGPADLVACHLSRLALLHGNAAASSVGHAALGAAVIGRLKDHRTGIRLGKVALQLCQQRGTSRHHTAVAMKFAATMSIWTHPLQNSIDQCARTYEIAMACGDGRAASRLSAMIAFLSVIQGTALEETGEEALRRRRAIRSHACDDEGMGDLCEAIDRFVGQQKGRTVQRRAKSGIWNEDLRLGHIACRVLDLMSLVLAHEYEAAMFVSMNLSKSIATMGSQIIVPEYWFWTMVAATATRSLGLPEGFEGVLQDFEHWADRCPQTFQHKYALLLAERARLEARDMDAMRAYDQAITEARENGFSYLEAYTAEIATRFYTARDFPLIAMTYFRTARNAYGRWGASAKMLQLDRRFPKLSGATEQSPSSPPPSLRSSGDMDVFTAVKVAQAVSKEIVLQRLLVALMKITIEHAAAERCHVLLELEDGELNHAGKALSTSKGLEIEVPGPAFESLGDILPASIIEHVRSTRESVCLEEAFVDRTWADDPYIAASRPQSVACFPILRQSTLVGMFYLENNSARGMFTPRRVALLEFLANQAAISLDHAKLYADLARENSERRRAEQVLRDKLEIIERQKDDIRALSTPLLDVSEGIVAMPILGELDEDRASRIMDVLLDTITTRSIRSAILDLTGVSSIGNATAEQIGRIVRAVELVGARAIVAGIRADVARAIVSLDVGLGRIETRASMKDALRVLVQAAPEPRRTVKNQSRMSR